MSRTRKKLIDTALITALKERRKIDGNSYKPFCLFDFIENEGVEIKYVDIASLEAIYSKKPGPLILLSSLRPHGRQYFNCAHEYGHHIFDHGMEVDEIIENYGTEEFDPNEFLVDTFAGFFLMPKSTVQRAFNIRESRISDFDPLNYYKIASNIGVGYKTLVFHLYKSLQVIDGPLFKKLSSITVKDIKEEILGQEFPGELIFVDKNWEGRPIDLQINDLLAIDGQFESDGELIEQIDSLNGIKIYKGLKTGIGRVQFKPNDQAHFLRVSRNKYVGFNKYKHLEE